VLGSDKLESDPLDLTGITGDKTQTLAVYASDTEVRILNPPQVRVKIRVAQHIR
jgi:YbbR domain-containing protein